MKQKKARTPKTPEEKRRLAVDMACAAAAIAVLFAICASCRIVFGQQISRWAKSFSFFGSSLGKTDAPAPNAGTSESTSMSAFFSNLLFLWNAGCGLMANGHWAEEWRAITQINFLKAVQKITWVPLVVIVMALLKKTLQSFDPLGKMDGRTFPYNLAERGSVKAGGFLSKCLAEFSLHLRGGKKGRGRGRWWRWAWIAGALAFSPIGPAIFDFVSGYFHFMASVSVSGIPGLFGSIAVDAWSSLRSLGWLNLVWAGYIAYRVCRWSALLTLREMQKENYDRANNKAVGVFAAGNPGTGKTTMLTSMALDFLSGLWVWLKGEMSYVRGAFPHFPFESLEKSIRSNAESGTIVNRAQFEEWINQLYGRWEDGEFKANVAGKELMFGYGGPDCQRQYFDGAKGWTLKDALAAYAQCYFLYYKGMVLITANYSIQDRDDASVTSFPLYAAHDDYLKKGCRMPAEPLGNAAVNEWDGFRLGEKMHEEIFARIVTHFDGGAVVWDELGLERGNSRSHFVAGKASPENDKLNQFVKLFRHFLTIDGHCVGKIFGNTQRTGSVDGDLIAMFEEQDWIESNDGEDNALPLWGIDQAVCLAVMRWCGSWIDILRNREFPRTFAEKVLQAIQKPFFDHCHRMENSYGFERLHVSSSMAASEDNQGIVEKFEYYVIWRKMRAYTFMTNSFNGLVKLLQLAAEQGYQEARHYKGMTPTKEDYAASGSYMVDGILTYGEKTSGKAKEAVKRISDLAESGTAAAVSANDASK